MANRRTISGRSGAALAILCATGAAMIAPSSALADPREPAVAEDRFPDREQRYRIQPGDLLSFEFRFTPEYNQRVRVQPDGYVSLPGIDDLKVGGLNVTQVRDAAVQVCRKQLRDPVITVSLEEFKPPGYIVGGEVGSPGRYELKGGTMLSEAIQIAGGLDATAHTEHVLLFRRAAEGWMEAREINFKKIIRSGLNEDIRLRPGDMVLVPRSKMGTVQRFMKAARVGLFFAPLGLR